PGRSFARHGPAPGGDRTARPGARSRPHGPTRRPFARSRDTARGPVATARPHSEARSRAVEKSTRAYSPVDRSSPEEPAARILGDRRAHAILWAEVRCAQPRSDARISAPGRAVLRACGNR